jgi:hypothetical protein
MGKHLRHQDQNLKGCPFRDLSGLSNGCGVVEIRERASVEGLSCGTVVFRLETDKGSEKMFYRLMGDPTYALSARLEILQVVASA